MKELYKKVKEVVFTKKEDAKNKPSRLRVYVGGCGWGTLEEIDVYGKGYIRFDNLGGSLVRDWEHFFDMVINVRVDDE
jgi:hypothetical protein